MLKEVELKYMEKDKIKRKLSFLGYKIFAKA